MGHRVIEDNLDEYLRGLLTEEVRNQADAHLASCNECRALVEECSQQFALEQQIAKETYTPQPNFRATILDKLAEERELAAQTGRVWRWLLGLSSGATIIAGVSVWLMVSPRISPTIGDNATPVVAPSTNTGVNVAGESLFPAPPVLIEGEARIPDSARGVTVIVEDPTGSTNLADPGTLVDVVLTHKTKTAGSKRVVIVTGAKVASADRLSSSNEGAASTTRSSDEADNTGKARGERFLVTLLLKNGQDANKLALASTLGTLSLAEAVEESNTVQPR